MTHTSKQMVGFGLIVLFLGLMGILMTELRATVMGGNASSVGAEVCTNGIDDDNDSYIDAEDPDCNDSEDCSNGADDDNDSHIDMEDPDCNNSMNSGPGGLSPMTGSTDDSQGSDDSMNSGDLPTDPMAPTENYETDQTDGSIPAADGMYNEEMPAYVPEYTEPSYEYDTYENQYPSAEEQQYVPMEEWSSQDQGVEQYDSWNAENEQNYEYIEEDAQQYDQWNGVDQNQYQDPNLYQYDQGEGASQQMYQQDEWNNSTEESMYVPDEYMDQNMYQYDDQSEGATSEMYQQDEWSSGTEENIYVPDGYMDQNVYQFDQWDTEGNTSMNENTEQYDPGIVAESKDWTSTLESYYQDWKGIFFPVEEIENDDEPSSSPFFDPNSLEEGAKAAAPGLLDIVNGWWDFLQDPQGN